MKIKSTNSKIKFFAPGIFLIIAVLMWIISLLFNNPTANQEKDIDRGSSSQDETVEIEPILLNTMKVEFPGKDISELGVWVAQSPKELSQGLSVVDELKEDQGMLFVFSYLDEHAFWMKDMKFPIDIIWLDSEKKIVSIKENADPKNFPESYQPTSPALYVLEVTDGFTKKHSLKEGYQLEWNITE
jgi:uncharacterized membrane protein (UPF0127 family)